MDPSLAVWVVDSDPSIAPGLPALLGERARVDPTGTIYFKIGPLDTDWALTPGGGGVPSAPGDAKYWVSTANATLTAEVDMGALTSGIVYQTVALGVSTPAIVTIGGGLDFTGGVLSIPAITAQYWVSTATANLANEVDMGALGDGVLRQVTAAGVSTPSVFSHTATYIPFGSGTNGWLTDSANLTYNAATNTTLIGMSGSIPVANAAMEVLKDQNAGTSFCFINPNAGANAYTAFFLGQTSNLATGATFGTFLFSSGSGFGAPYGPNIGLFELAGGASDMHFWIQQNFGDYAWFTKTTFPAPASSEKMRLTNDGLLGVGNSGTFPSGTFAHFNRSTNGVTYLNVSNANAGTSGEAGVILSQSATTYTNYMSISILGTGYTTVGPFQASGAAFEHVTNTTAPMFFSAYGTQPINFYTTTSRTLRLNIATGGGITMSSLSAGGIVKSTAGLLEIASASDVAGAITWPTAAQVLVSSGTTTAPVGDSTFTFDTTANELALGVTAYSSWYAATGVNYSRVRGVFGTSSYTGANTWLLASEVGGTGTIQNISIEAGAANASVEGAIAQLISVNGVIAIDAIGTAGSEQFKVITTIARASSAGMVLDAHEFTTNLTISGSTNITTATGVNAVFIRRPVYDGNGSAKTITNAASLYIANSPLGQNSATITNAYAVWVDAGLSRFDGDGTNVFELPADATANATATQGRIPILVGGATKYLRYYND